MTLVGTRSTDTARLSVPPDPRLPAWPLVLAGLCFFACWLAVVAATYSLTEAEGYTRGFVKQLPGGVAALFDRLPPPDIYKRLAVASTSEAAGPMTLLLGGYGAASLVYVSVLLYCMATRHPSAHLGRIIVGTAIVVQALLLFAPGILSTDLFSYAAYGHLTVGHGANPYETAPAAFAGQDAVVEWVAPYWRSTLSVYGPLWTDMSVLVTGATWTLGPYAEVFGYRVLASGAQLGNLALFWRLIHTEALRRRFPGNDHVAALAAFAWNPLMLVQVGLAAHNDVLVETSLLVALLALMGGVRLPRWLTRTGRDTSLPDRRSSAWNAPIAALALLAGALVKLVPLVVGPLLIVIWWHANRRGTAGRRAALLAGVVALVGCAVISYPWVAAPGFFRSFLIAAQGGAAVANDLQDLPARWVAARFLDIHGNRVQEAQEQARTWIFAATRLVFALYLVWEGATLVRRYRAQQGDAQVELPVRWSRTLALFILLVPRQVRAWYLVWPVCVAFASGMRSPTSWFVMALGLAAFPAMILPEYSVGPDQGLLLRLYVGLPLALGVAIWSVQRIRALRRQMVAPDSDTPSPTAIDAPDPLRRPVSGPDGWVR